MRDGERPADGDPSLTDGEAARGRDTKPGIAQPKAAPVSTAPVAYDATIAPAATAASDTNPGIGAAKPSPVSTAPVAYDATIAPAAPPAPSAPSTGIAKPVSTAPVAYDPTIAPTAASARPDTNPRIGVASSSTAPVAYDPTIAPTAASARPDTNPRIGVASSSTAPVAYDPTIAPSAAPARPDTNPGIGVGAAKDVAFDATVAPAVTKPGITPANAGAARAGAGIAETLPAGIAGKAGHADTMMGSVAAVGPRIVGPRIVGARPTNALDQTAAADGPPLDDETGGGTLPGPYTVADLPTLPRVDDSTYAIGAEIARGGMGKILAARDRRLRREVVIKVMRRDFGRIDPRFEREALITARLQHPSIVRVYDAGVLGDGRAFYAMERVRGRSLEVVLEESRTLRARLALLPHAIAVCDALAYAHNEGIVHRDLKPSNVLLGPFGETVVIDWGLAKDLRSVEPDPVGLDYDDSPAGDQQRDLERAMAIISVAAPGATGTATRPTDADRDGGSSERATGKRSTGSSNRNRSDGDRNRGGSARSGNGSGNAGGSSNDLTQHGAVMGTPAFMAPEQARGEMADERTDVYALGALLYTLLTGAPPVTGTTTDELIEAVATGKRKRIVEVEPGLPPELASIVEHAMGHDRAERYQTAKQLADDLRSFAAGKLVPRHVYTTWQLVRRWISRNRLSVGIAAAAVLLLVVGGIVAFVNISAERDLANRETAEAQRQRMIAIRKRDNLIIGQAVEAYPHDPSTAAAWLKRLGDDGLARPEVAAMAQRAARDGLAINLPGHRQDVEIVASTGDGRHVATASDDGMVRYWDLTTRGAVELVGHTGPIDTMAISSDGAYLATGGTDHKVVVWTLATGQKRTFEGHGNTVRGVAFSPDTTQLASTSEDGSLYVWNLAAGTGERVVQYSHSLRPVTWFDAKTLLAGAFNGQLLRIDLATKKVAPGGEKQHNSELRSVVVTPDRQQYLSSDEDGRVVLWNATTNRKLKELVAHEDVAREIVISADGKHTASCGGNNEVHLYTLPDGVFSALKGNEAGVKDLDISADGLIAGAGIDGVVRVWRLDGTLVRTWRGHTAQVKGVAFVGRNVVSGAEDKMVRVWSLDPPPPPPSGVALRGWLETVTNVEIPDPDIDAGTSPAP